MAVTAAQAGMTGAREWRGRFYSTKPASGAADSIR